MDMPRPMNNPDDGPLRDCPGRERHPILIVVIDVYDFLPFGYGLMVVPLRFWQHTRPRDGRVHG